MSSSGSTEEGGVAGEEEEEEDEEDEKIDLETFLSKCKEGLAKASATFKAESP